MAPAKLQHPVLLALGLAAVACADDDEDHGGGGTDVGACLDHPADAAFSSKGAP